MAKIGEAPIPSSPASAIRSLDAHLPIVLKGQDLAALGWSRPDPLTLLVPLDGQRADGTIDPYLLRLHFGYYPEWPPSARFVNPDTKEYHYPTDLPFVPIISDTKNEIQVHPQYHGVEQLICASVTLEFYIIRHDVLPEHVWDGQRQNFAATINAIRRGLKPPLYQGPQQARPRATP